MRRVAWCLGLAVIALNGGCATTVLHSVAGVEVLRSAEREVLTVVSWRVLPDGRPELVVELDDGDYVVPAPGAFLEAPFPTPDPPADILLTFGPPRARLTGEHDVAVIRDGALEFAKLNELPQPEAVRRVIIFDLSNGDPETAEVLTCDAAPRDGGFDLQVTARQTVRQRETLLLPYLWFVPLAPVYALAVALDIASLPVTLPLFLIITRNGPVVPFTH